MSAKRVTIDTSQLLHIPPLDLAATPPHAPPPGLRVPLFDYQARTLTRMTSIEALSSTGLSVPGVSKPLFSKGGVVADVVGLGKTAVCIARILADACQTKKTLVVTPTHLAKQWLDEMRKFADPGALQVRMVNEVSLSPMESRIKDHNVVIVTVEFLLSVPYKLALENARHSTMHSIEWRRVIFDECHETILFGHENMKILRSFTATNVWCVSGTPFTHADQSIFGIHQLLNIDIKLNVTNNPFALMSKTSKYRNEAFEYLKKLIYLRNTPESIAAFRKQSGSRSSIPEPKYQEHIIFLPYTVFERAFYDERLTRIGRSKDLYSETLEPLRQLCCHPEASNDWNQRLADLDPRANRVFFDNNHRHKSSSSSTTPHPPQPPVQKGLSLAQLPARMIKVKKSEIARLDATRDRIESRIASAEASIKYIDAITNSSTHVKITERVSGYGGGSFTFYDMSALLGEKVEEWAEVDETGRVRLRAPTIDGGGAVGYVRAEEGMQTLSQLGHVERMAFVKSSKEWIEGERRELEEVAREKAQVEAEIRYFLGMVEGLKNAEAGNTGNVVVVKESESAVKDEDGEKNTSTEPTVTLEDATTDSETVEATTENKEDTKENSQECLLCAEDVTMLAVLSCGHSSCRRCLNAWMEKNKSCPTCRKIIKDGDEIFEVTTGTKVEPVAPAAPVTVVPPVIERPEPMVFKPVPPIVMKHGTKPAAVADFLRKTLAASPDNRIIVFSKWHSMLNLLAKTLNALNIPNLFPKKALNQKVAQEAYEATTMSTPVSKGKKRALPSSTPDQYETSTSRIADPINEFKTSSEFRILMLSLQESASGTNLQCANTIVMLEPASGDNSAHAIATEQQAIGRAVRFGQTQLVRVYKFIVRGTIEEDLYRFQETERKKRVMLTEGNVVHLRRSALIEVDADFTSTDIVIGEDRIVEEEGVEEEESPKVLNEPVIADVEDDVQIVGSSSVSPPPTSNNSKASISPPPAKIAKKALSFSCPICNKDLEVDSNADVNIHVDECLMTNMAIE